MKKKERVIPTWPVRLSKELILSPRLMVEAFLDPFSSLELEHELPYFDLLFVRMFGEFGVLCTWITSSIWLKGVPSFLQEYLLLQVRLLWSWLSLCLDWSSFTEFARFDFIDNLLIRKEQFWKLVLSHVDHYLGFSEKVISCKISFSLKNLVYCYNIRHLLHLIYL